jgi:hypothetical protein
MGACTGEEVLQELFGHLSGRTGSDEPPTNSLGVQLEALMKAFK